MNDSLSPRRRGPRARRPTTQQYLNKWIAHRALRQGTAVAQHKPVRVFLQIASACNLDCYMCSEHNRPPELRHGHGLVSLERDVFDRVAEEVFPHSTHLGLGIGGEPMLSENFEYFVERAFELGQRISLLTNGTRIKRPGQAEILARCVGAIDISMDGATKETYERIRLGSRWTGIRASLDLLNECRMQYKRRERAYLTLCFVLMKSNVHELPAFVEFAHANHADAVHAHHVIPVTTEGEGEMLIDEPERYNHFRALAMERARELGVYLDTADPYDVAGAGNGAAGADEERRLDPLEVPAVLAGEPAEDLGGPLAREVATERAPAAQTPAAPEAPAAEPPSENDQDPSPARENRNVPKPVAAHAIPCGMPTTDFFILYDGRVFPCCHPTAHEKMMIGNLVTQSFSEIWNNHLYRSLRAGLFTGDAPEVCTGCSIVHDPPPATGDAESLARSPALSAYYEGRDVPDVHARVLEQLEQHVRPWALGDSLGARAARKAMAPAFPVYEFVRDPTGSRGPHHRR